MESVIIACLVLNLVLLSFLAWRLVKSPQPVDPGPALAQALSAVSGDLSARIIGASAETKQEVADRLNSGMMGLRDALDRQLATGRQDLTASLESVRGMVDQKLGEIAQQVQSKLDDNIREGFKHFDLILQHLREAEVQLQSVGAVGVSINELNSLLKLPHLRGGFGEATLERLLADFLPAALFELQYGVVPGSGERVDAVVKFPNCILPIDSKFPREQILPLFDSVDPQTLTQARMELARVMKSEAKRITKYISPEHGTTEMALMFLPSETLYFEVIRDPELWGQVSALHVFPVSPNTLAVTLAAVGMSHQYYELARGVEKTIEQIRKAQKHFANFQSQFEAVGKRLHSAQEAFDKASTRLSRYGSSVVRLTGEAIPEVTEETSPVGLEVSPSTNGQEQIMGADGLGA